MSGVRSGSPYQRSPSLPRLDGPAERDGALGTERMTGAGAGADRIAGALGAERIIGIGALPRSERAGA